MPLDEAVCACPDQRVWVLVHLLANLLLVTWLKWGHYTPIIRHEKKQGKTTSSPEVPPETIKLARIHDLSTVSQDEVTKVSTPKPEKPTKQLTKEDRIARLAIAIPPPIVPSNRKAAGLQEERRQSTSYAAYIQMLKVGLPRSVVEHKIRMEGKDPAVLDDLLALQTTIQAAEPAPEAPVSPSTEELVVEQRSNFEPFLRMLKVGMPRHVVEHKIRMAGLDPAELDSHIPPGSDYTTPLPSPISSTSSTPPSSIPTTPVAQSSQTQTALTASSAFFPALALRSFKTSMRKKIHWNTHSQTTAASGAKKNSLWSRIHAKAQADRVRISTESKKWMEKLFVKAIKASGVTSKAVNGTKRRHSLSFSGEVRSSGNLLAIESEETANSVPVEVEEEAPGSSFLRRKIYVTLLDVKKSQNIAIILARIKKTFPELTKEILLMNPVSLSANALHSLLDMWPDSTEEMAIDTFMGDITSLATAERFLIEVRKVPRVKQKLHCLLLKLEFQTRVQELRLYEYTNKCSESIEIIIQGVHQVCSSETFGQVLEYIFHMGNLLNFGDEVEYTTHIKGFSIGSLAKLSYTKAYDGRITFLQYVVQSIERDEPQLAHFYDDIKFISKCSKVSVQNLTAEYKALEKDCIVLRNETQQSAIINAAEEKLREELTLAHSVMKAYASEVQKELDGVKELMKQLEHSKKEFLNYFEEEDNLPLDELLGFIAGFVDEYKRERENLVLRARPSYDNSARSASFSHVTIPPNLFA